MSILWIVLIANALSLMWLLMLGYFAERWLGRRREIELKRRRRRQHLQQVDWERYR
jgi:hypothetical protein